MQNVDSPRLAPDGSHVARCPLCGNDTLNLARGRTVNVCIRCLECGARFEALIHAIQARALGVLTRG